MLNVQDEEIIDPNQEVVDMCKAIADMRSEERTEGRKEGIKEGVKEGIKEANKATALRMLRKGGFSYEFVKKVSFKMKLHFPI